MTGAHEKHKGAFRKEQLCGRRYFDNAHTYAKRSLRPLSDWSLEVGQERRGALSTAGSRSHVFSADPVVTVAEVIDSAAAKSILPPRF